MWNRINTIFYNLGRAEGCARVLDIQKHTEDSQQLLAYLADVSKNLCKLFGVQTPMLTEYEDLAFSSQTAPLSKEE